MLDILNNMIVVLQLLMPLVKNSNLRYMEVIKITKLIAEAKAIATHLYIYSLCPQRSSAKQIEASNLINIVDKLKNMLIETPKEMMDAGDYLLQQAVELTEIMEEEGENNV